MLKVYKNHYRRQPFTHHPALGWWALPNVDMRLALGQTYHRFITNSRGLREDVEFTPQVPAGKKRIMFLGDSYTAGDGVDNAARFSNQLARLCPTIETMNLGLNNSGTDQQVLAFEEFGAGYDADAYVFGICPENIVRNLATCRPSWDYMEAGAIYRPKPYFTLENGALQLHQSPVPNTYKKEEDVQAAGWVNVSPRIKPYENNIYSAYRNQADAPWQLMQAILRRFLDRVHGKPVFLIGLPMVSHYMHHVADDHTSALQALAANYKNVFVVNPLTAMCNVPMQERLQTLSFPGDPHYTAAAHAIVADVLLQAVSSYASHLVATTSARSEAA
jgi:carbamoyltransferase